MKKRAYNLLLLTCSLEIMSIIFPSNWLQRREASVLVSVVWHFSKLIQYVYTAVHQLFSNTLFYGEYQCIRNYEVISPLHTAVSMFTLLWLCCLRKETFLAHNTFFREFYNLKLLWENGRLLSLPIFQFTDSCSERVIFCWKKVITFPKIVPAKF